MKDLSKIWILFCIIAVILSVFICMASADTSDQAPPNTPPGNPQDGKGMSDRIQNLTDKGFDMTQIKAALDSGDKDTARSLLDEFYKEHPEEQPARPPMSAEHLQSIVQNLSQQGNDVSSIQNALTSGDTTTAQNLLDQFWKDHPDLRPAPPQGEQPPQGQNPPQ